MLRCRRGSRDSLCELCLITDCLSSHLHRHSAQTLPCQSERNTTSRNSSRGSEAWWEISQHQPRSIRPHSGTNTHTQATQQSQSWRMATIKAYSLYLGLLPKLWQDPSQGQQERDDLQTSFAPHNLILIILENRQRFNHFGSSWGH